MSSKKSMKTLFYKELVSCLKDNDYDKYKDVYDIAKKSAPECFSNKKDVDSKILQMLIDSNETDNNGDKIIKT